MYNQLIRPLYQFSHFNTGLVWMKLGDVHNTWLVLGSTILKQN